jgi:serine/threonine protein phosphatase 1
MSTFALGDPHGQYNELIELLSFIAPTKKDKIIVLGDFVDWGPDTNKVVEFLFEERYRIRTLTGNHERMLINGYKHYKRNEKDQVFNLWYSQGGRQTLESFNDEIPEEYLYWMDNKLRYKVQDENNIYVHAGLTPGKLRSYSHFDMTWIRDEFINSDFDFKKTVIFGHTCNQDISPIPTLEMSKYGGKPFYPIIRPGKIGIDCGIGTRLCAYCPEDKMFYFCENKDLSCRKISYNQLIKSY